VADADDVPTFAIPQPPVRRYPRRGGVQYDGETVFSVTPEAAFEDPALASLVESVFENGPYRYGDWFDLPMPLYLVHDDETGDTFRVAVRDGRVEFHVGPETGPEGLRALYVRLVEAADTNWHADRLSR
jgi:hypothetical protein